MNYILSIDLELGIKSMALVTKKQNFKFIFIRSKKILTLIRKLPMKRLFIQIKWKTIQLEKSIFLSEK